MVVVMMMVMMVVVMTATVTGTKINRELHLLNRCLAVRGGFPRNGIGPRRRLGFEQRKSIRDWLQQVGV